MGKDQAGNGVMFKDYNERGSNFEILDDSLNLLMKKCTYFVNEIQNRSVDLQDQTDERCNNIDCEITKNQIPILKLAFNQNLLSYLEKCIPKSDLESCDSRGGNCENLDNFNIISAIENSPSDPIGFGGNCVVNCDRDSMIMELSVVDNCANNSSGKDNKLYDNGCFSNESFYHGVPIPDITRSHCFERSYAGNQDNDLDIFSRHSPSRKSLSPRRSPSPYSCGSISNFREPGNISSQNFQGNWKDLDDQVHTSLKSTGMCETNGVLESNLSEHKNVRDVFFSYEINTSKENVQNEESSGRSYVLPADNGANTVYAEACTQNNERNPCHPHIPVVQDEVKLKPTSPTLSTNLSMNKKSEDGKQSPEFMSVQSVKNESLVRISHFLFVDNEYKRVIDVRTVTELMNIYKSLKGPIILPFVRQRSYYDQWARFPCAESINRNVYTRSNTNMSIKCWTLLQAIQNDQASQIKSNSAPSASATGTGNKLAVPNPADVTCKSLESIIEHYNQLSSIQNILSPRIKTPPATPLKNVTSKTLSAQSSSSRSSSGNSNDRQRTLNQYKDQWNILPHTNEKHSPVPLRKKPNSKQLKCKGYDQNNDKNQSKTFCFREDQTGNESNREQDKVNCESTTIGNNHPIKQFSSLETSISRAELYSSADDLRSFTFSHQDNTSTGENHYSPVDPIQSCNDKKGREHSVIVTVRDDYSETYKKNMKTPEKRGFVSPGKDISRDPYDVNTNTVKLNLPHEIALNRNDCNENTGFFSAGDKRGFSHQSIANSNNGLVGLSRRSKTKLLLSQMCPKQEHREISLVASPLHNPHELKQSLFINEIQCSKDIDGKYPSKRDKTAKNTGRSRSCTSWKSPTHKPPELPTRGYSMCDRLEPSENPGGRMTLSPDSYRPRSERQSAVSLANVHFLDLTDLKTMLRKTNTPIPRL